jgi:hypothetical protein
MGVICPYFSLLKAILILNNDAGAITRYARRP